MGKQDTKDLMKFLKPFPEDVRDRALWLRDLIWELYPKTNELIYDNYNALALGWSPTDKVGDTFCSIAVGRSSHNVHFGFYWGSKIADPERLLLGQGNQYRYIIVKNKDDFPRACIKKLMKEAYAYSCAKMKGEHLLKGATITKSVSPVKKTPRKTKRTK